MTYEEREAQKAYFQSPEYAAKQKAIIDECMANITKPEMWANKDLPKNVFDERVYDSPRMTDTKDHPEGYMGD